MTLATLLRETDPNNMEWDTPRIWRAIMLAPTLEICVALLNREPVPHSRLDPAWVKALGLA